jgi:DNA-binding transcriptional LysR family regulator
MDLIASLKTFVRVSETKSFSAVAAQRGVTQPAISRQITALEEHLGLRLVQRSTQAINLTEDGHYFLPAALELVEAADAMVNSAAHRRNEPVGMVRLGTHMCLGLYMGACLPELLNGNDKLSVDLVIRDRFAGIIEEGLDLEIRLGVPKDLTVIARRIGYTNGIAVASPAYLQRRPSIARPGDLAGHECVEHSGMGPLGKWSFRTGGAESEDDEFDIGVEVSGRFSSNNSATIHTAVLAGHGIGCLPEYQVWQDLNEGRLIQVLPEYSLKGWPIFVCYPTKRTLAPRVRAVIDFLIDLLKRDPLMSTRTDSAVPETPLLKHFLAERRRA